MAIRSLQKFPAIRKLPEGKVPAAMADANSPELIAFNKCSDSLRRGVHPDDLVTKLFARGILSDGDKSEANKMRRAQIMLDAVESKVNNSPQTFHDVVSILANEPAYTELARILQGQFLHGPSLSAAAG